MCVLLFAGCTTTWDGPETNDQVTGNGSLAVQKGNYLYFVNGYTAISDMEDGSNKGNINYSGLYRVKLGDNNSLSYDEDGNLENCKKIVSKVVGYDRTSLYIFGDYLYYSTPYSDKVISDDEDDKETTNNFDLTEFYSVKLDGSSIKKIYTTSTTSDSTQFAFYQPAGSNDVSLAVYDGSKLVIINCSSRSETVVAEDVQSVAMPIVSSYNKSNNQVSVQESAVYYTRSGSDEENLSSGNVFAYTKIGENTENIITKGENTYTVKSANRNAVVYTKKSSTDENTCNFYLTFDQNGKPQDVETSNSQQLDYSGHDTVFLCDFEEGNSTGIIYANSNNNLVLLNYNKTSGDTTFVLNDDLSLTPLCLSGNYVYAYDGNNSLYRINYKSAQVLANKADATEIIYDATKLVSEDEEDSETQKEIYFSAMTNFSINGDYVYFYVPYEGDSETGYYLNRVSLISADKTAQLVGVVQSNHIATETEE
jgi:hypothetical protein